MSKKNKTGGNTKKPDISKSVEGAFTKTPSIGQSWTRWYDGPYRLFMWSMTGWRRNILPSSVRTRANRAINHLLQFNVHDRNKVRDREDRIHNLLVPEDEHIFIPSILVVELFSPNEVSSLERALVKNGWDKKHFGSIGEKGNIDALNRSRSGKGYLWWKLASIVDTDKIDETKNYVLSGSNKEKLPPQFKGVQLKAVQVSSSLTAIVAQFTLTEEATDSLDNVWHDKHEPIIIRENGRLYPQSRKFSAFRITQSTRRVLHDAAREWMSLRCSGFFATHNEPQLVTDVMLTSKYDPTAADLPDRDLLDSLRALGIDGADFQRNTAKELPRMLFMSSDSLSSKILENNRTWSLIGNRDEVAAAHENFKYQGGDINLGSSYLAVEYVSKTMLILAVTELLSVLEQHYATLRDTAKLQHSVFRVQRLKRLSQNLLNLSLTLSSVRNDLEKLKRDGWKIEGADFNIEYAPHVVAHDKKLAGKSTNMSKHLQGNQMKKLEHLTSVDKDYRDILSTVASLGASANSIRITRWALAIAALSLFVALVALKTQTDIN